MARKSKNSRKVGSPTRAEASQTKLEADIEALVAHPARPYKAAAQLCKEFGFTRRAANNWLARARTLVVSRDGEAIADLGRSLIFRLSDALQAAKDSGDLRSTAQLVASAIKLIESQAEAAGDPGISGIDFHMVEPQDTIGGSSEPLAVFDNDPRQGTDDIDPRRFAEEIIIPEDD